LPGGAADGIRTSSAIEAVPDDIFSEE
jgi:hypothetical protein